MCHNGAFAVWFLHSKKGGKIQTGLNCEVDSLSKACLWLAYSREIYNSLLWFRSKLHTSLILIQKVTLNIQELIWNPISQSDIKYSILLKLDVWKTIPKIPWFCSLAILCLRVTKHARKSRNRLARHKALKLQN